MPRGTRIDDSSIFEAALIGLEYQHGQVEAKMAEIRRTLGIRAPRTMSGDGSVAAAPKRTVSLAARRKIGAAQKKRWAESRKAKEAPADVTPKKRKMSAAGRKRVAEATKKRWAAFRAQKAAAAKKAVKPLNKAVQKTAARKEPAANKAVTTVNATPALE